ncbi:MAG: glycosyltransferase family 4 protein [Candidatus Lokiarchaeia archaeon]
MNIWLIQTGEPLPLEENIKKMRTAFLAEKLIERGHSVVWWASAFDHLKKKWVFKRDTDLKIKKGLRIIALRGLGYKGNISFSRFIDHRIIASKFRKLAKEIKRPDIIITSTPPYDLAYQAVMFSKKNNIPVLVDIRDEWPDLFLTVVPEAYRKFLRMLLANDFRMIEKTMWMANGLIAMMESLLDWGLRYAGRCVSSKDKVFYLGSKRSICNNEAEKNLNFLDVIKNRFVITFVGTFVRNNNPSILIDCAENLIDSDICFILAGNGELFNEIQNRATALPNVFLPGWLNHSEIDILLKHSHIGICPSPYIRNAFPNKMFSYLSAGLPVISSFQGELKEIIEKYQIGLYCPPNDVDVLVNCIKKLYNDEVLYKKMAENARRVFNEKFDADKIYEEYAGHIERIAHNYKQEQRKIKKDNVYKKHE